MYSFFTYSSIILFLISATSVHASVLSVEPYPTLSVATGDIFEVTVVIDTEGDAINAVEGVFSYPGDLLSIERIADGNSLIDYWIESPRASLETIHFSGITTSGFSVRRGALFTIRFKAESEGTGTFVFRDGRALKNDGMGTEAPMRLEGGQVDIQNQREVSARIVDQDNDLPEVFDVYVTSDATIRDGAFLAIFATQDKGSGISHYAIREGLWGPFSAATSPHVLTHQSLDRFVFVRAYDHAGNIRTRMMAPINPPYVMYAVAALSVLLIVIVLLYFGFRHTWHRVRTSGRSSSPSH